MQKSSRVIKTLGDKLFDMINIFFIFVILAIVLYPLYLIVIASISDPYLVMRGEVLFCPKDISFSAYKSIFNNSNLWQSYLNSIIYTISSTAISIVVTMAAAYATSRRFLGKSFINFFFVFTMFFSGGLIPTFLTMRDIGLYNNPLIIILSGCVSVWNLMLARTYINTTIPEELYDSAAIDGTSHFMYFFKIILPLSSTIIAVLSVYYGIAKWNDYFTGLVYLRERRFLPLQTVLREILAVLQSSRELLYITYDPDQFKASADDIRNAHVAKYCVIVVSTVPAVFLYLLMQKYFVKGVMVGSLKG